MEEKQNFPRATGFSGKILIALLFILSGILLFARNMGWITSEVFDLIVSWHSLLIIIRYICNDSPPFHRWNHPFSGGCLFSEWNIVGNG